MSNVKLTNVTIVVDGVPRRHLRFAERVRSTYRWHDLESGDHGDLDAPADLDPDTLVQWVLGDWVKTQRGV